MTDEGRISLDAYRALYPADALAEIGGATCLRMPGAPDSPMLNRIVGLGSARPPTEADVDAALAFMGDVTFYVSLEPEFANDEVEHVLVERGLEPGWGWMRFARRAQKPPAVTTALDVRPTDTADAATFARIQRLAYGLPEEVEPRIAAAVTAPGWSCWIGFDGDDPAAAGALFVQGEHAYLGLGATLAEHRGKGGQGAIFAARIEQALDLGCTALFTETGERRDALPSNSYRNILRYGFEERDVLRNWVRKRG